MLSKSPSRIRLKVVLEGISSSANNAKMQQNCVKRTNWANCQNKMKTELQNAITKTWKKIETFQSRSRKADLSLALRFGAFFFSRSASFSESLSVRVTKNNWARKTGNPKLSLRGGVHITRVHWKFKFKIKWSRVKKALVLNLDFPIQCSWFETPLY